MELLRSFQHIRSILHEGNKEVDLLLNLGANEISLKEAVIVEGGV